MPDHILNADSTEIFLLIGLNWLSESEDCKFEIHINDMVVDGQLIRLSADEDAAEVYHVPISGS